MAITIEQISDHIIWAEINRPEARNAIDFETINELEALVEDIEQNDDIRLFVLSSAGRDIFVAGGDLKKFHTIKSEEKAIEMSGRVHTLFNRIEKLPCWTIACINGDAYGGGVELMLCFDFRLAVPGVKFGFTQGRFYLTPGWGGLTRLVEKVGRTKALMWQGKAEIITAEEALKYQVIEEILDGKDLREEVLQWAEKLIKNDRDFIQTLKQGASRFATGKRNALDAEIEPFAKLWVDEKHLARVEKFMNKKK
ncbi:MAG: enoyl-CoA hydratase/isomerase family protein [Balneolaceae bacterium]|nr:enoyl-CoA hydratase/isomerase family protein [Balneolaceae bacterium]